MIGKIPDKLLSCQLGRAVHAFRRRCIKLCQRFFTHIPRKYIVGRNVHQLCLYIRGRYRKVSGSNGIDFPSQIHIGLTLVHIGIGGAVNNCTGLYLTGKSQYLLHLCDIQFSHICVDQLIFRASCILLIDCPSKLSVAACDHNLFHKDLLPYFPFYSSLPVRLV